MSCGIATNTIVDQHTQEYVGPGKEFVGHDSRQEVNGGNDDISFTEIRKLRKEALIGMVNFSELGGPADHKKNGGKDIPFAEIKKTKERTLLRIAKYVPSKVYGPSKNEHCGGNLQLQKKESLNDKMSYAAIVKVPKLDYLMKSNKDEITLDKARKHLQQLDDCLRDVYDMNEKEHIGHHLQKENRHDTSKENEFVFHQRRAANKYPLRDPFVESEYVAHDPGVECEYVAHNPGVESEYVAHNPGVECEYVAHNPGVKNEYVAHNPGVECEYVAHNPGVECEYVAHNPGVDSAHVYQQHSDPRFNNRGRRGQRELSALGINPHRESGSFNYLLDDLQTADRTRMGYSLSYDSESSYCSDSDCSHCGDWNNQSCVSCVSCDCPHCIPCRPDPPRGHLKISVSWSSDLLNVSSKYPTMFIFHSQFLHVLSINSQLDNCFGM